MGSLNSKNLICNYPEKRYSQCNQGVAPELFASYPFRLPMSSEPLLLFNKPEIFLPVICVSQCAGVKPRR